MNTLTQMYPEVSSMMAAADLADQFGRASKLFGGRLAERLSAHGLSMPRFQLLAQLARHGPLRLTELGTQVGISQGTASTLTESLVRDGLIRRRPDPLDGRATRLELTAAGRQRAQAWLRDYERAAEALFAGLSAGQRAQLAALLRTLTER
jgi:DNA-binding MarR family transcriptional regulator